MRNRTETTAHVRSSGFTLVEVLLAVALTAVVAVLAYAGIGNGVRAAASVEQEVAALGDLQRAFAVLQDDLAQVRLRPLQLGIGYREAALAGSNETGALLVFTRGGVAQTTAGRSDLQRVRYVLRDGTLWRQHWPQLDRVDVAQPPRQLSLLAGIDAIRMEFLGRPAAGTALTLATLQGEGGAWLRRWDSDETARALTAPLPLAVRVTLTTARFGQVQRVFELP